MPRLMPCTGLSLSCHVLGPLPLPHLRLQVGRVCDILYTVYRLSSGGYYRYSGGGTPVLLYGLGYGYEGADDVGSTYRFTLGDRSAMPVAGTLGMVGMREGGRRRILVPPQLGWGSEEKIGPLPRSFGGRRRLANHNEDPLLLEVEVREQAVLSMQRWVCICENWQHLAGCGRRAATSRPQLRRVGEATEGQFVAAPEVVLDPFKLPAPPSPYKRLLGD